MKALVFLILIGFVFFGFRIGNAEAKEKVNPDGSVQEPSTMQELLDQWDEEDEKEQEQKKFEFHYVPPPEEEDTRVV